jgi:hypothetical protein
MQTTLVTEAAKTGAVINMKHAQFLAPDNMIKPAKKCESVGNSKIILTERGYTFGYNDLVVDPRAFYHMRKTGYPVVFDITHSIRKYGIPSADPRGGNRDVMPTIARAGVAAGVDGVFIETHPDPSKALCDAASQLCVYDLEEFLKPSARPPRRGSEAPPPTRQRLIIAPVPSTPGVDFAMTSPRTMELYLDSADIKEIDEAFKLGFLTGLTTTPTFMHRGGVTNIDKMILDLAKKVPILQVEALGETAEEVVKEAKRQLKMGLKKETTVFKIPVSLEGLRACRCSATKASW